MRGAARRRPPAGPLARRRRGDRCVWSRSRSRCSAAASPTSCCGPTAGASWRPASAAASTRCRACACPTAGSTSGRGIVIALGGTVLVVGRRRCSRSGRGAAGIGLPARRADRCWSTLYAVPDRRARLRARVPARRAARRCSCSRSCGSRSCAGRRCRRPPRCVARRRVARSALIVAPALDARRAVVRLRDVGARDGRLEVDDVHVEPRLRPARLAARRPRAAARARRKQPGLLEGREPRRLRRRALARGARARSRGAGFQLRRPAAVEPLARRRSRSTCATCARRRSSRPASRSTRRTGSRASSAPDRRGRHPRLVARAAPRRHLLGRRSTRPNPSGRQLAGARARLRAVARRLPRHPRRRRPRSPMADPRTGQLEHAPLDVEFPAFGEPSRPSAAARAAGRADFDAGRAGAAAQRPRGARGSSSQQLKRSRRTPYEYVTGGRGLPRQRLHLHRDAAAGLARRSTASCSSASRATASSTPAPMALLLRMAGIPARVSTGFTSGALDGKAERVRRARPRRPLVGRGLVPRLRLGHLRPDARRRARRAAQARRREPQRRRRSGDAPPSSGGGATATRARRSRRRTSGTPWADGSRSRGAARRRGWPWLARRHLRRRTPVDRSPLARARARAAPRRAWTPGRDDAARRSSARFARTPARGRLRARAARAALPRRRGAPDRRPAPRPAPRARAAAAGPRGWLRAWWALPPRRARSSALRRRPWACPDPV